MFFLVYLICAVLVSVQCDIVIEFNNSVNDTSSYTLEATLQPNASLSILVNVSAETKFVVVQSHSFLYPLTLRHEGETVQGTNLGLVISKTYSLTLANTLPFSVLTLIAAVPYFAQSTPVPGRCNMEWNPSTSPYLVVSEQEDVVSVVAQPASSSLTDSSCNQNALSYSVFRLYSVEQDFSPAEYFKSIERMLVPENILQYGSLVPLRSDESPLNRWFSAYRGTGSTYVVVVESRSGFKSAYAPAHSYGCSYGYKKSDTCSTLTSTILKSLALIPVGLSLLFLSQRYDIYKLFVMASLTGSIICYVILTSKHVQLDNYSLSLFIGFVFGCAWLCPWCWLGSNTFCLLVPIFNLAFLITSIVMFAFLGDVALMSSDWMYWVSFGSISLTLSLTFLYYPVWSNMLSNCIIGAFITIWPIDYIAGSGLKYILIDVLRRMMVQDFGRAVLSPPIQIPDVVLIVVWVLLSSCGLLVHACWANQPHPLLPSGRLMSYEHDDVFTPERPRVRNTFKGRRKFHQYNSKVNERTPLFRNQRRT